MNKAKTNSSKWYHYPIVWFMIAIPISAILSGFLMLYFAFSGNDVLDLPETIQKRGLVVEHKLHPNGEEAQQ